MRLTLRAGSGPVVFVGLSVVAAFTAWGSRAVSTDGWLSLVAGREIVRRGLPTHDRLTVLGSGRDWIDQQWLGQLTAYGVHAATGLGGLVALNIVLVAGTYVGAMLVAVRRGATPRAVAAIALVGLLPYFATANPIRTQSLAYPLFVTVLAGASTARLSLRRVLPLIAVLVLWANLHGSVLLGAAIVAARGLVALSGDRRRGAAWVAAAGAPAAVFCSPYATGLVSYYRSTAFNGTFGKYLTQWAPTRLGIASAPVFALLLAIAWLSGRSPGGRRFDRGVLFAAALVGLLAVRNWPWFVLAAIVLLPAELDRVWLPGAARRSRPHLALAGGGVLCALALAVCISSFGRVLHRSYPAPAADAAARAVAARSGARLFASVRLADWLLWRKPELAGRIESDARYELLRSHELEESVLFLYGAGVDRVVARDRVFVLDPRTDHRAIDALPNPVIRFRSREVLVAVVPRT